MSYPQGPSGGPGYQSAPQQANQFSAPTQTFTKLPDPAAPPGADESKLPAYLTAAAAALGLLVYLSSFGPLFTATIGDYFTPTLLDIGVAAALLAALFAGVGLLPNQKARVPHVAVLSVLAALLVIAIVLTAPDSVSIAWGLWLIVAFTVLQAIVAVAALLFDSGVLTPPAPRPKYEQYGQFGQPYYGQLGQPHLGGPPQRPGYPTPYGAYPGTPQGGGYGAPQSAPPQAQQQGQQAGQQPGQQHGQQSGPPTPPTGFPAYGQPPGSNAPTAQVPAPQSQSESPSSSGQAGPPPS